MVAEGGAPDALLLITGGCQHCPAVLQALTVLLKEGVIGRLRIINVAAHIEEAETRGIQSVPWTQIGAFEIEGVVSVSKLRELALGVNDDAVLDNWVLELLKAGKRQKFEALVRAEPPRIHALARLLANPETSMAIRLGIGAVLEELHGSGLTEALIPALGDLLKSEDRLLRTDACHFLTLIGGAGIRPTMRVCLEDADPKIREMAQEALGKR